MSARDRALRCAPRDRRPGRSLRSLHAASTVVVDRRAVALVDAAERLDVAKAAGLELRFFLRIDARVACGEARAERVELLAPALDQRPPRGVSLGAFRPRLLQRVHARDQLALARE